MDPQIALNPIVKNIKQVPKTVSTPADIPIMNIIYKINYSFKNIEIIKSSNF